jgi:hypothetical protein
MAPKPKTSHSDDKVKDSAVRIKDSAVQLERSTARVEDSGPIGVPSLPLIAPYLLLKGLTRRGCVQVYSQWQAESERKH